VKQELAKTVKTFLKTQLNAFF